MIAVRDDEMAEFCRQQSEASPVPVGHNTVSINGGVFRGKGGFVVLGSTELRGPEDTPRAGSKDYTLAPLPDSIGRSGSLYSSVLPVDRPAPPART